MSDPASPSAAALACEFLRLARYLVGAHATPYQMETYLKLQSRRQIAPKNDFDRLLDGLARRGFIGLALADAYSGVFHRRSVVRAKLVAALAILECSPPSFRALDAPDPGGRLVIAGLALRGAMAAAALALAAVVLGPAHAWCAATGRAKA
jgi:hypothetical protein